MTPEQVEREYNNRQAVPDHPKYFERWDRDSDYSRRTLGGELNLAYGPHKRQRIDLFPAKNARGLLVLIGDIVDDVVAATNWLFEQGIAKDRVVISGHSAGGHLAAAVFASKELNFDPDRVIGGVPISGVFDLTPLPHYSANVDLRLDDAEARSLGMMDVARTIAAPVVVCAGGDETSEFQRQSRDFAAAWAPQARECHIPAGYNHFSILDAFTERGQRLHDATLELFE